MSSDTTVFTARVPTCGSTSPCCAASLSRSRAGQEVVMRKIPPLQRFDAAVKAYISSRRALGRAIRLDEYVLRRLRSYLARAGYSDLDGTSFARWRRCLCHCAHNTQVDWPMMVYRFCRYRRRRESRCFLPQRWTLGRHRPYPLPTPINADQVQQLLDFV